MLENYISIVLFSLITD